MSASLYYLPMLESIDHVNLVVRDLEGMADFYTRLLGMKITKQVTISGPWIDRTVGLIGVNADVIYLDLPQGPRVELLRYNSPPGHDSQEPGKSNTTGLRHLAFRVSDIDAVVQILGSAGVKFFSDVQLVPDSQVTYAGGLRKRLVYFHDPEENLLELCEYKKAE
jgi:catechol 2,3-dioxygenase-like lactoylglutathione lyase family enzyme